MGYPPADGELELATSPEDASPETDSDQPDHVGVQLDALAGMVARQGQALTPVTADSANEEDTASDEAVDSEVADTPIAEAEEPTLEAPQARDQTGEDSAEEDRSSPAEEIDPLTAPLAALTGATAAASSIEALPSTAEPAEPAEPVAALDSVDEDAVEIEEPVALAPSENTGTAGRATAILRPAQLLIVATAALNMVLVGLNAVLVAPSGSLTMVTLGVALITLAAWTGAAVTFLHWVSRAHAHVAATAASRQRHGPSMSLMGWFIPIVGFIIGYRVLQDLWTGSDPATRDQADASPAKARSIDIWLLGIVTAALFGYAMPLALGESALWAGLSALGLMVAALSLASTMGAISAWQVEPGDASAGAESELVADPVASAGVESAAEPTETLEATDAVPAPEPVSASAE